MESYGLRLTNNSKTGPAFSLPRITCINKTETCWNACYGHGIRYQNDAQRAKRQQNYRTVMYLLKQGGPELLAENLVALIDQARPVDWLTAKVSGTETAVPFSLRLHDLGDFVSSSYAEAWTLAVRSRPECSFWFYTRSFLDNTLFAALTELAALPNCQGWLSLDRDNYCRGILAYASASAVWKIALLQEHTELMPPEMIEHLSTSAQPGDIVSFPKHHGGRHVPELLAPNFVVCPQILGGYPLEHNPSEPRPCQSCNFCLSQ